MGLYRFLVVSFAFAVLNACSLPHTTRTAAIHDVEIRESLSSDNLLVQPGDEVRWVNLRKDEVRIEIPQLRSTDLACQRGFSAWYGSLREDAVLKSNETASLCFEKPAVINYNVRAETAVAGGRKVFPGVIKVGTPMNR